MNRKLLWAGIIGSAVTALCCFTPLLVLLFGVLGLSTLSGYLDFVLFPFLFIFIFITVYALLKMNRQRRS